MHLLIIIIEPDHGDQMHNMHSEQVSLDAFRMLTQGGAEGVKTWQVIRDVTAQRRVGTELQAAQSSQRRPGPWNCAAKLIAAQIKPFDLCDHLAGHVDRW